MITAEQFIERHQITMKTAPVDRNPAMPDWQDADHWKCVLSCGGRQMTTCFSMGKGHGGRAPKVADVLYCLASDASGYDGASSFEEWAAEYGYDADSRSAERTYDLISKQARELEQFLGSADDYQFLLYEVENA